MIRFQRAFVLIGLALAAAAPLHGETLLAIYSGKSFTDKSDLTLSQPAADTRLRFRDVAYDDESFTSPIYYGAKVTHFFRDRPWLGASVDFFHYKVFAGTDRTVRANGRENGAPVDRRQRLDDTVQRFSISHGVNYLTLNLLARGRWRRDPRFREGRVQPYAGAGVGVLLLHPESAIGGESFQQYEWNGVGYQLFLGVDYRVTPHWGLFVEYKYNSRDVNVEVVDGTADTGLSTHHLAFGASYRL
jgi:opacity protein-like surface antigen